MATKSLDGDVQQRLMAYVRRRIDQSTQKDLAIEWGVAQSYLSSLMNGKAGGGGKLLKAIAETDPSAFRSILGAPDSGATERTTEITQRYSNREQAIQLLVADGRGDLATVEEAANRAAVALDAEEDQSVLWWVESIRPFVKAVRRGNSMVGMRELEDD